MDIKTADTTVTMTGDEFIEMLQDNLPDGIEGEISKVQVTNVHVKKDDGEKGHTKTDTIKTVKITVV